MPIHAGGLSTILGQGAGINPLLQLGLSIMAQPAGMGAGQQIGRGMLEGLSGMQEAQQQQALNEYRRATIEAQKAETAEKQAAAERLRALVEQIQRGETPDPSAFLGIQGLEDEALALMYPGPAEPPKTRERLEGGVTIQEQFDPATRKWTEIGRGPRWAPTQPREADKGTQIRQDLIEAGYVPGTKEYIDAYNRKLFGEDKKKESQFLGAMPEKDPISGIPTGLWTPYYSDESGVPVPEKPVPRELLPKTVPQGTSQKAVPPPAGELSDEALKKSLRALGYPAE